MNKILKTLTKDTEGIKLQRAQMLAQDLHAEYQNDLNDLKNRKRLIEKTILNLSDLSPDTTISLKAGKEGLAASDWYKEMKKAKLELMLLEVEEKAIITIYEEWFKDEEASKNE